ncbi:unnamed protein product [Macrosiphum euphorbiae]|uniref:Envelope fusion protein n=1 Tax=Macrosiphum euphorbiae TaxID=13131 RepID=A0AAV0XR61_9HEMI|nr:unnamed protein product [Macrosiphum euphorbiae]
MDVWNVICRTMLLQFLLINHSISSENQDNAFFNLTLTTNSPGLQYEILGEGKLCKSSWTINTFIDLKYLINSHSDIRDMLNTINTYAIKDSFQITVNNLEKHLKKINLDIQVIRQMARYRKKVKRSFESGGSALQWMFGIADADDVRRYDSSINKLENDQTDMIHIVQDQVSILRSTITNFNETITTFNDNKLLFDKNIKKIVTSINNINIELVDKKNQIIVLKLISLIENNIFELDIFVTRLQRMISNVQTNKLDVFIITPDQLLSEIKQIENILPENLQIPIKFNETNIQEIYKIIHIDLHPMNDRIIFSIKIPLCISEIFKFYYIIPIYVPFNEHGQFIHIAENPTYLLTDDVVTKYFIWSNINNCLIVADIFVCGFNEMLHNSDTDPTCVTEILKNALTKPTQCDTYITEFKKELWYPSFFKNNWYFVCEKPTTITIICNNRYFIRKITLKSSGKLFLKGGCQAHTTKGVLITEQTVESSFATLPLDLSILNDSCCNITLNQRYPKPIHLDEIKNLKFDKEAFIKIISKLNTQDELLNSILLNKTYEFVYTNKYLIITIVIIILYASIKFCIKKKKKKIQLCKI